MPACGAERQLTVLGIGHNRFYRQRARPTVGKKATAHDKLLTHRSDTHEQRAPAATSNFMG